MTRKMIRANTKFLCFTLAIATSIAMGVFFGTHWFLNERFQSRELFIEDCIKKISDLQEHISSLTLENLDYKREATIYEELSEIQELKATIFASRFAKIKCEDSRSILGQEFFSYTDTIFVKFYFAYNDDFTVERNKDSIEVSYTEKSFIAPYSIECRLVNQNKVAEIMMSIENDDHIIEIISAVQGSQASEIEDILISELVNESSKTEIPLIVNGIPISEWTDGCKLYHETPIPEFDGYTVSYPSSESENN